MASEYRAVRRVPSQKFQVVLHWMVLATALVVQRSKWMYESGKARHLSCHIQAARSV